MKRSCRVRSGLTGGNDMSRWLVVSYFGFALGLGAASAQAQVITEFNVDKTSADTTLLGSITAGPDGNLWFTEYFPHPRIGKITPAGVVTQYSRGFTVVAHPEYGIAVEVTLGSITAGPDGNLWFTEGRANRIGKITSGGVVTEYSNGITQNPYMEGANAGLSSITAGPDGNLWFTETYNNQIGKISTTGVVTEYSMSANSFPYIITAGPDGNLWFTEVGANRIGKITPAGVVTEYSNGITPNPLPGEIEGDVSLHGITAGPDGNLWFTETYTDRIGKITTAGVITEYSRGISRGPYGITAGRDGNLWFTENYGGGVGKITTAGVVTEYSEGIHLKGTRPSEMTVGPDGNVWLVEEGDFGNRIGRIMVVSAQTSSKSQPPTTTSLHALSGVKSQPHQDAVDWLAFEDGSGDFIRCWDGSMENGVNCSERLGETARDSIHNFNRPDYIKLGRLFEFWFILAQQDADFARKGDVQRTSLLMAHLSGAFGRFHDLAEKLSVTPQNICQLGNWHHGFQSPGYDRAKFCSDVDTFYKTAVRQFGP